MSSEWEVATLGDCLSFASGNTPSKAEPRFWGGLTPWISAKDMKSFWVEDSEDHLTPEGVAVASKLVAAGTTLLLTRGMTLHNDIPIVRTRRAATFNQDVKAMSARTGIHPGFVPYLLLGNKARIQALVDSAGHGTGRLGTEQLKAMQVVRPPLTEQRELSKFLAALDDRIALLRETNATLEAIAQALFKSWFVDFDPVRAKQQGLAPADMDEATAALFPGDFEESAMGLVPKGWRIEPVGQVVEGIYDGPHATPPEADVGPVFLGIKNLTGSGLDLNEVRHIAESDFAQWTRRVMPRPGDIVFSYEATLGFFALIPPGLRCCLGRRLALIRPRAGGADGHFLLHQFISAPFQRLLERHTIHGATVNRIALKQFPSYHVLNPPDALKAAFDLVAAALWARIHENQAQAATLATLRDALLPRLISGQLRLPEAEALIEETA